MFACHSCIDSNQLLSDTHVDRAGLRRVFCDPLWNSIQAEALAEADHEPLLRPLLQQAVLDRDSVGDGLAMVLGQRLSNEAVDAPNLYEEFRSVIAGNAAITESARSDLLATRAKDLAVTNLLHPFLNFKGLLALQAYRIAHALWMCDRRTLAYYLQNRANEVFSVDIHPAAKIGAGVFIDHGTGVVIGETAVVGNDVTILHGVTLGGTGKESGDRHPKIGNDVLIGAGAQLLGSIHIGEGSRIGASSVVLKNVEAYSTVAGVPARVVRRRQPLTIPIRSKAQ